MLVAGDVKGLEIVCAAELSGDPVLCQEIIDKKDIHGINQEAFGLPDRLIAKIFKFRLIYGGSAYSYSVDPDFSVVGYSQKQWQGVIDRYYEKYKGLGEWHNQLLQTVRECGYLEIPSGRVFFFSPKESWRGLEWPLTTIKNYPVQGYGADLVMLARIELARLIRESGLEALLVMTVHDSLVVDTPKENIYKVADLINQAIDKVPELVYTNWSHEFKLPMTAEVSVGRSKAELVEINKYKELNASI
jgi:DNA polymerase-1